MFNHCVTCRQMVSWLICISNSICIHDFVSESYLYFICIFTLICICFCICLNPCVCGVSCRRLVSWLLRLWSVEGGTSPAFSRLRRFIICFDSTPWLSKKFSSVGQVGRYDLGSVINWWPHLLNNINVSGWMYSYVKFVLSQVCFLLLIWASSFPKFDSYFLPSKISFELVPRRF